MISSSRSWDRELSPSCRRKPSRRREKSSSIRWEFIFSSCSPMRWSCRTKQSTFRRKSRWLSTKQWRFLCTPRAVLFTGPWQDNGHISSSSLHSPPPPSAGCQAGPAGTGSRTRGSPEPSWACCSPARREEHCQPGDRRESAAILNSYSLAALQRRREQDLVVLY